MKIPFSAVALLVLAVAAGQAQEIMPDATVQARGGAASFVVDHGRDYRVWQKVITTTDESGKAVSRTDHAYVELAAGLHYLDRSEWRESREEIEIVPGGAVARHGTHKVKFASSSTAKGAIELEMDDGQRLRSHVVGLAYKDVATGQSVLIAEVKESLGKVVNKNQVMYEDTFTDFKADLRYTYTRGGFEQDVILRELPPAPEEYGLNSKTTRLLVLTEFIKPRQPRKTETRVPSNGNPVIDEDLDFGPMSIGRGKAFSLGAEDGRATIPVTKQWLKLDGRDFLVEEVAVEALANELKRLPRGQRGSVTPKKGSVRHVVSRKLLLPAPVREHAATSHKTMLAVQVVNTAPGLVLDYLITLNSNQTDYTFKADTTYYISSPVTISGTATFEGGTVIKYAIGARLFLSAVDCQTSAYRPAIFTAKDDDTVGEIIPGSTGVPAATASAALEIWTDQETVLEHVRIAYCDPAVLYIAATEAAVLNLRNVQILNCYSGLFIDTVDSGLCPFDVKNSLFANVQEVFTGYDYTGRAEHLTVANCDILCNADGLITTFYFTNSIFVNVPGIQGGLELDGANNGFHNSITFGSNQYTNTSWPFQTVGAGSFYLANGSSFRDVGTTNVQAGLLAEVRQKTTFPPVVFSNVSFSASTNFDLQAGRDINTPDLGYHYDPLDYVFGGVSATANLSFTNGAAVAWFQTGTQGLGIKIGDGAVSSITFAGSVNSPCWFGTHSTVQEGNGNGWISQAGGVGILFGTLGDQLNARFTKWSMLSGGQNYVSDESASSSAFINLWSCEFYGGDLRASWWTTLNSSNTLFRRASLTINSGDDGASPVVNIGNCLFWYGKLTIAPYSFRECTPFVIRNTAFDGTDIVVDDQSGCGGVVYNYNAFRQGQDRLTPQGGQDVIVTDFNWQTGPLGDFYLPTGSSLTDGGSTSANLVGLYHFTTATNQVKETNSTVDIGYHYVAVDANGNPLDNDVDGLPDYVEDANGNGIKDGAETEWQDYYGGVLPTLTITLGDNQSGAPGTVLPLPLTVLVTGAGGVPLANAPLTFAVTLGAAQIATNAGGPFGTSVELRTAADGQASVYALLPSTLNTTVNVKATAFSGTNSVQVTFVETTWQGLRLWLRADAGVTTNGSGQISLWADQSGNANNASQGTGANQPIWTNGAVNGRPSVRFDGADDHVTMITPAATNNFTIFAVARTTAGHEIDMEGNASGYYMGATGQRYLLGGNTHFNPWGEVDLSIGTNGISVYEYGRNQMGNDHFAPLAVYNGPVGSNFSVITVKYTSQRPRIYGNGGLLREGLLSSRTQSTTARPIGFGSTGSGPSPFAGELAEMIIFDRSMSDEERLAVEAYLNTKYAVVANAPADPTDLVAVAVSTNQVSLTWNDAAANTLSFRIERKQGAGAYQEIAVVQGQNTSYLDSGLAAGTQYYYRLRASNLAGDSGTVETDVTTLAAGTELPLGDLRVWLRADAGVIRNGNLITHWRDQSGYANHADQQTNGYRPVFLFDPVNGRPTARFDGVDDHVWLAAVAATNNFTIFAVARTTAGHEIDMEGNASGYYMGATGQRYLLGGNTHFNPWGEVDLSIGTNGISVYEYGRNQMGNDHFAPLAVYNGPVGSNFSVITIKYTGQQPRIYGNGGLLREGLLSSRSQSSTARPIGFGSTGSGPSPFVGDMAELMIFNRSLSDAERLAVEAYLNGKYLVVPNAPDAPTDLAAVAVSTNQVSLTWNDAATNTLSFKIERKQGAGAYQEIAVVQGQDTSYLDSGLAADTEYYYRVRASNLAGDSGTVETTVTTLAAGVTLPLGDLRVWLKADAGISRNGNLITHWRDQSGYANHADQQTNGYRPVFLFDPVNGRPTARFDGVDDHVWLAAVAATNNFTIFAVARTTAGHQIDVESNDTYNDAGNTGQRYLMGGNTHFNEWGEVDLSIGTNGISVYEYGRNQMFNDHFASLAVYDGPVGSNFSVVTIKYTNQRPRIYGNGNFLREGLVSSRTQSVTSRPIGFGSTGAGTSPFVGDLSELLIFKGSLSDAERRAVEVYLNSKYGVVTSTPAKPTNLVATAISPTRIDLTWSNVTPTASVQIERKAGSGGTYAWIADVPPGISSYSDTGLPSGQIYFYQVRAANLAGVSPYSDEASAAANYNPAVTLTEPTNNATFTRPVDITLTATASDVDGTVSLVEFFYGSTKIGEDNSAPFTIVWSNPPMGPHSLTAKATDNLNGTATSPAVNITVNNRNPGVAMTAPANNSSYQETDTVNLAADASDLDGTITKVEFFRGGTILIGEDTSTPYTFAWTAPVAGTHSVTAVATDNDSGTATSSAITVTVNDAPTVSITAPVNNETFNAPANITITANASDTDGTVSRVDFYSGLNFLGSDSSSPYSFAWNNVAAGTYKLKAVAHDNAGGSGTSALVNIEVRTNLVAIADAHVRAGNQAANNFGTSTNVEVQTSTANNTRWGYFKFSVPSSLSNVVSVKFRFHAKLSAAATVGTTLYRVPTTNWIESGSGQIIWNNKPATGASLASTSITGTTFNWYELDVTSYVLTQVAAGSNVISIALTNPASSGETIQINSREATTAANRPTLAFTVTNFFPEVAIVSPANGTFFSPPADIPITAQATTPSGTITQVELFSGTTSLGVVTTPPYSLVWDDVTSGTYNLTARVTDSRGLMATSSVVTVYVDAAPTVSVTAPANGATFVSPANITITADAADSDGSVSSVEFFQGSTSLGSDASSPYSVAWNGVAGGSYALTARATDNLGLVSTSSVVNITVFDPPTITSQPQSQIRIPGSSVTFSVTATGSVPLTYQWQLNGVNLNGQTSPTLALSNLQRANAGSYTVVVSNAYGSVTSAPAVLTISVIAAWGSNNSFGQTNLFTWMSNYVAAISAGSHHSLALRNDGTVMAWGNNSVLQLQVPSGLSNAVMVSAGGEHSLALRSDGTVIGWGHNGYGQANHPAGQTFTAIEAGENHTLGIRVDKTVMGWGNNSFGQTNVPAGLTDVIAVSAFNHSLALKGNGTVVAWGLNTSGQTNVPPGLANVIAISAGPVHSLVARTDGTVTGWGANTHGQLNIPSGLSNVIAVAAGATHSMALKSDGTIVNWGGDSAQNANAAVPSGLSPAAAISAGYYHSLGLLTNDANLWPNVVITNPINNASFTNPASISIMANATDRDGTVSQVDFYVDGQLIGSDTSSPYSTTWNSPVAGIYSLSARATDNLGATKYSAPVTVNVTAVASPAADATVKRASPTSNFGSATVLEVQLGSSVTNVTYFRFNLASAPVVTSAKLRINAKLSSSGSVGTTAYSVSDTNWGEGTITWNNRPALGSIVTNTTVSGTAFAWYELDITSYVRSELLAGRQIISLALSNPVTSMRLIQINSKEAASNQPQLVLTNGNKLPTVSLVNPTNGAVFLAPANITIDAAASDPDGTISKVEFFEGANKIGEDTSFPYSFAWLNVVGGTYSLTARATDSDGATRTSSPVSVTVNVAPTITLTSPTNNAEFLEPASIALAATATDSDGTVTKVEFYAGAVKIAETTNPPFTGVWQNVPAGDYFITARAIDNLGAVTVSAGSNVTVYPLSTDPGLSRRLGYWRFEDTNWLGEMGQAPKFFTNLQNLAVGANNHVLQVDSADPANLKYRDVEMGGSPNIDVRTGTIAFRFKPNWDSGTGPGQTGYLLAVGNWTAGATHGFFGISVSADGTTLNFISQTNGAGTTPLTATINWTSTTWHQITLTYTSSGSILYVDGQSVATGSGVANYPGALVRAIDGLNVGSDRAGSGQAEGQYDELETFNYPLSATDIAQRQDTDWDGLPDYWETQYGLNPLSAAGDDGASGDPDEDGVDNLTEYRMGRNPQEQGTVPDAGQINLQIYTPLE